MSTMVRKLLVVAAAMFVAIAMLEAPAQAAPPKISIGGVVGDPVNGFSFKAVPSKGRIRSWNENTFRVTALGVTYASGDPQLDVWPSFSQGVLTVDFWLTTTDPLLQPQSGADFTDVSFKAEVRWRTKTLENVRHTFHGSMTKRGNQTSSRHWTRLRLGGSCNYGGYSGRLLVTCLWARSVVTYRLVSPMQYGHKTRITGASVSMEPGLYPCHTSVAKHRTSPRSMRVTVTTSNASGFAQCWLNRVKATYQGHYTTQHAVYHSHHAVVLAEWHAPQ